MQFVHLGSLDWKLMPYLHLHIPKNCRYGFSLVFYMDVSVTKAILIVRFSKEGEGGERAESCF